MTTPAGDEPSLASYAAARGLPFRPSSFALPQATQILRHGFMREVTGLVRGDLPGGLDDAWLAHVAYVYSGVNDLKRSPFTLLLIEAPESLSFAVRVLCHDRDLSKLDMSNPDSDREIIRAGDRSVRLESEEFLSRFALFADSDQDENSVWRLFAPTLIHWLNTEAPKDFSFELQDGALCCFVPGSLTDPDRLDEFCAAGARVFKEVSRIGEADGTAKAVDPDSRRGQVERALAEQVFNEPPKNVKAAAKAFRRGLFISDEAWRLGAEAFFREQSAAAGFERIEPGEYRASHIGTILPGDLAHVARGADDRTWRDCYLVITDNTEYDTMGWTMLVADGRSPSPAAGGLPVGISADRGLIKLNTDGRSLIFSTLDGGKRDRSAAELGAFIEACRPVLAG